MQNNFFMMDVMSVLFIKKDWKSFPEAYYRHLYEEEEQTILSPPFY